jgi:hypothetical protein
MKRLLPYLILFALYCASANAQIILRGATLKGATLGTTNAPSGGGGGATFPTSSDVDSRLNANLTDSSGNGNTLTLTGSAISYGADEHGTSSKAIILNGSDNYLSLSSSSVANYTTTTFSFWIVFKATDISGSPVLFNHGTYNTSGYYVQVGSDGHLELQIGRGSAPSSAAVVTAAGTVTAGTWYAVLIIVNGSAGQIYVNGTDATSHSDSLSAPSSDSNNFRIGAYVTGSNLFPGTIAETTAWSRALNSTERTDLFSLGSQ